MSSYGESSRISLSNPQKPRRFNTVFDRDAIDELLILAGIDLSRFSLEELWTSINMIEKELGSRFLRMDFGVPGLRPSEIGIGAQIDALVQGLAAGQYPPSDGLPRLKEAVSLFLRRYLSIDSPPECCIPTCGSTQAAFIAQAVAGKRCVRRDTILFLEPGYPPMKAQARLLGLKSAGIDLYDHRGEDLVEKIETAVKRGAIAAVAWSSPNNPTWNVLTENELRGIARICDRYDVVAIEDATYLGMHQNGGRQPRLSIATFTDNYFLLISASKMLSYAGERVGVLATSKMMMQSEHKGLEATFGTRKVARAVSAAVFNLTAGAPHTAQYAVAALLEAVISGSLDLEGSLISYSRIAKRVKKAFVDNGFCLVYEIVETSTGGDGFYFTFRYPGLQAIDLIKELLYYGISALPLELFGSCRRDGLRGCVALIKEDDILQLEQRLARFRQDH